LLLLLLVAGLLLTLGLLLLTLGFLLLIARLLLALGFRPGLSLILLITGLLGSLLLGLPARRVLLFLPVRPLLLRRFLTLPGPVRGLLCRLARFAGISGINGLLIKDLVDQILFFEELCPLNFELLGYSGTSISLSSRISCMFLKCVEKLNKIDFFW